MFLNIDSSLPNGIPIVTEFNEYDFIKVDMKKYIDFVNTIKDIDWIIDIQELNIAHSRELLEIYKGYEIQRRLKIKRFKELTSSEKRKSYNMKKQYDFIEYKMKAIGDYLYYRLGQIKIEIPEEVKDKIKTKSKAKKITDFIYRK